MWLVRIYSQWLKESENTGFELKDTWTASQSNLQLYRWPLTAWPHACSYYLYLKPKRRSIYSFTSFSVCPESLMWFLLCPPDLIHCTNELNVSIPHLADTLLERTASNSWIVVFKALITTHHLMMYGSEVSERNILRMISSWHSKLVIMRSNMFSCVLNRK